MNLPKRVAVSQSRYVKVQVVPRDEIGGDRGEWQSTEVVEQKVFGVIRIAKDLSEDDMWMVFREELSHALIDAQRWHLRDLAEEEAEVVR